MKSKRRVASLLLGFALVTATSLIAFGATDTGATNKGNEQLKALQKLEDLLSGRKKLPQEAVPGTGPASQKEQNVPGIPASPSPIFSDPETLEAYQTAMQAYYRYRTTGLEHRSRVFQWQLFSAQLLFVVVLILVFAGVYFAAVQFHLGLKHRPADTDTSDAQDLDSQRTELSASIRGIKVSSPVLGVIILALSLAFFYLYLVHVFPIEEIF